MLNQNVKWIDVIKKHSKHAASKNKIMQLFGKRKCSMIGAYFTKNILYYAEKQQDNEKHKPKDFYTKNCIKESAKTPFRNAKQIIKIFPCGKKTRTIQIYLSNCGS